MNTYKHFRVDIVPSPAGSVIEIRSKPYNKLMFKASSEGLLLECKRCRDEHLFRWTGYSSWSKAPYASLIVCPVASGEFKLYILRTLTPDELELIAKIKPLVYPEKM